jgi:hypothetical protein
MAQRPVIWLDFALLMPGPAVGVVTLQVNDLCTSPKAASFVGLLMCKIDHVSGPPSKLKRLIQKTLSHGFPRLTLH